MSRVPASEGGTARAWGWLAHLREGGTTPWDVWTGDGVPTARVLPGAQQLELLRRLNLAGPSDPFGSGRSHLSTRLVERVLTAPAPGRGKPDLPLVGVSGSAYGPKPVDPGQLRPDELIRVATSVLAEDVVALGLPQPRRRLHRVWHRGYRLAGDPLECAHVRDELSGRGRPPGGPGATTMVLGGPLDQMLADVWTRRCFERGSGGWLAWLRFWQQRGQLPPRIDLPAVARRHLAQGRVTVVLDPSKLPKVLGVRRLPPPVRPGADAAELARRIATVIGLLVEPDERAALMTRTLLPRMPATPTPPPALPEEHRGWVIAASERMARDLRRAGYPVLGDTAAIRTPAPAATGSTASAPGLPAAELVLDLAVRMLVDEDWKKEPR